MKKDTNTALPAEDHGFNHNPHLLRTGESVLTSLWTVARNELETSQITKILRSKDLPTFKHSEHERRGEMGKARLWRIKFFRKSIAALLTQALERGLVATTEQFWQVDFPRWWFESAAQISASPPISPSEKRPPHLSYASSTDYRSFANGAFRERVKLHFPYLCPFLSVLPYDASDTKSFTDHAQLLSAVSVISTAQRLDLCAISPDEIDDILLSRWLDAAVPDPLSIRFRNKVWPNIRYNYVDLHLRTILAQALCCEHDEWDNAELERNLPLTEGASRTTGGQVEHTGLRRSDIEIAVWCEAMARMLDSGFCPETPPAVANTVCVKKVSPFDELPPRLRLLTERLKQSLHEISDQAPEGSRFVANEAEITLAHKQLPTAVGWNLGSDVIQLPSDLVTPVLENDHLTIQIDWSVIAPDAEWIETCVIALFSHDAKQTARIIEFEDAQRDLTVHLDEALDDAPETLQTSEDDPVLHLRLIGENWMLLQKCYDSEKLESAVESAKIACQTRAGGDGATVLILIDMLTQDNTDS